MTNGKRRRILFICYFFPPFGAGGVFRALKFAKYLPEFGWDPTILTAKPVGAWVTDDSLLDQVNCPVIATKSFHPVGRYRNWKDQNPKASPMLKKCLWWLCERFMDKLMIPDTRSGWVPYAIAEGLRLHRKRPFDLILTNSPPHSSHAIGLALKKLTGLPWIADFKDGWIQNPFRPTRSEWRNALESLMERSLAKKVDHLVTISEPLANYFEPLTSNPVTVIPNGYDEEDFQSLVATKNEPFTIGYFGSIFGDRDPTNFLRGVEDSLRIETKRNPRIIFVGPVENSVRNKINSFANLDVEIIPYLPHRECLSLMKSCHALVNFVGSDPQNEGVLTGKIFEYLRSNVPVMSICPRNGALWKFLQPFEQVFLSEPERIESISASVLQVIKFSDASAPCEFPDTFSRFERKNLTAQLAELFQTALPPR